MFFNLFNRVNINDEVKRYKETEGALLIDLRDPQDYKVGHIPGAKNMSLNQLGQIEKWVKSKNTPIFLYCYSGTTSGMASGHLKSLGYSQINNIGGISGYQGPLQKA